jgi:hypothetical protein
MATWRSLRAPVALTLLTSAAVVGLSLPASAEPPGIPDETTAAEQLAALQVAPDGSMDGYSREEFPHWSTVSGSCNTREEVLKRDGENVETGSDCAATSGSWFSPYDGETWTQTSDVDIDHVVALAAAWRTGASEWTREQREAFANDLEGPQLIAVTDNVNQEKGDQSPDTWKPPLVEYHCTYAKMWIGSKSKWQLTINEAEKAALEEMLGTC